MKKNTANAGGKTYAGLDVSLKETAVCIVEAGSYSSAWFRPIRRRSQSVSSSTRPALNVSVSRAALRRPGCGVSSSSSAYRSSASTVATPIASCQ